MAKEANLERDQTPEIGNPGVSGWLVRRDDLYLVMGNVVDFAAEPITYPLFTRMELHLRSRAFGTVGCGSLHQLFSLRHSWIACPSGAVVPGPNVRCLARPVHPIGAGALDRRRKNRPQ